MSKKKSQQGLGNITVFQSQAVPAKSYMYDLMDGGHTVDNQAELMGLGGSYIQPANRFGQVQPVVLDSRGHQQDNIESFYAGGKTPWHITSSKESGLSPDSGTWTAKNIEGQYVYTPSVEQLNQKMGKSEPQEYIRKLNAYFPDEEASQGHVLQMPVPVSPEYASHNW